MRRMLVIALSAALFAGGNVYAEEHTKKARAAAHKKEKAKDLGASCKAPAVGACASCAITCRPGETATCGPGMVSVELCARPPSCACK
jgi:hypothetical protein